MATIINIMLSIELRMTNNDGCDLFLFEPPHEKTVFRVSDQVQHRHRKWLEA